MPPLFSPTSRKNPLPIAKNSSDLSPRCSALKISTKPSASPTIAASASGASAWTTDDRERERFINELESGMVFINKMVASDPRIPFGGVKYSGHGRELATNGIREFMNIKTVWIA